MTLSPGTRVGSYEIVSLLGAGGMGEVYRARDGKLKREVAIKVLPAEVANDRDRLGRFRREAEVLASLNHQNIAHVHGFEEAGGMTALVMELVDGEDLAVVISRGPLPIESALPIAKQIAEALECAHEQGVIHRDLKPANIKVRADGTVKVLDFGLAKAMDPHESTTGHTLANSPTITSPAMTMRGVILGTAAYMAPEQAKGKPLDKRADIWAFGCVLYEMLTAQRAFDGEDVTDTIVSVMSKEPDWSQVAAARVPPSIQRLTRRCLVKDRRNRLPDIAAARIEIADAIASGGEPDAPAAAATLAARTGWTRMLAFGAVTAVIAAALGMTIPRGASTDAAGRVLRYTIDAPTRDSAFTTSISPDGRFIVVAGRNQSGISQLWVRALDGNDFVPMAGTAGASFPFWSADGTEIAFFADKRLMRVKPDGGDPQELANTEPVIGKSVITGVPASWGADGTIVFGFNDGLYRVEPSGSISKVTADAVPSGDNRVNGYTWPHLLPQSGMLFTTTFAGTSIGGALHYQRSFGTPPSVLIPTRSRAQYSPDGLLIARGMDDGSASLTAQPFDPKTGQLGSPGVVLAADVSPDFSASHNGIVVYRHGQLAIPYRFDWLDAAGQPTGDGFVVNDQGPFNLSRDNSMLAYISAGTIFIRDLARGVTTRLASGVEPVFSPDAQRVAYSLIATPRSRIVIQPASGGPQTTVFESEYPTLAEDWSSDGKYLVANQFGGRGLIIPLDSTQPPTIYVDLPMRSGLALDESRFSPDGRWLLYNASESGRPEVYLSPVPPTGERWQLSNAGGAQGRWRADSRAVFYHSSSGELMVLDIELTPRQRPRIGPPRSLFKTGINLAPNIDQFAPAARGDRFLFRRPVDSDRLERLNVIVNWPALASAR